MLLPQQLADVLGAIVGNHPATVHDDGAVSIGEDIFQPVLRDDNSGAKLHVDLPDGIQKVAGGNGVQLAGGFIQNQHLRLHGHDGGQIQKLLLAAGEIGHIPVEPVLNAKITGHLRHAAAHGGLITAQTFQPEGQLMPHLVGDDLVVGVLHDIADFGRLIPLGHVFQGDAVEANIPAAFTAGSKNAFQMAQESSLAAAAAAA